MRAGSNLLMNQKCRKRLKTRHFSTKLPRTHDGSFVFSDNYKARSGNREFRLSLPSNPP